MDDPLGVMVEFQDEELSLNHLNPLITVISLKTLVRRTARDVWNYRKTAPKTRGKGVWNA
jgi:hypothetical protein